MSWTNRKRIDNMLEKIKIPKSSRYTAYTTEIIKPEKGRWIRFRTPLDPSIRPSFPELLTPKEVTQQYYEDKKGSQTFQLLKDDLDKQEQAIKRDEEFLEIYEKMWYEQQKKVDLDLKELDIIIEKELKNGFKKNLSETDAIAYKDLEILKKEVELGIIKNSDLVSYMDKMKYSDNQRGCDRLVKLFITTDGIGPWEARAKVYLLLLQDLVSNLSEKLEQYVIPEPPALNQI